MSDAARPKDIIQPVPEPTGEVRFHQEDAYKELVKGTVDAVQQTGVQGHTADTAIPGQVKDLANLLQAQGKSDHPDSEAKRQIEAGSFKTDRPESTLEYMMTPGITSRGGQAKEFDEMAQQRQNREKAALEEAKNKENKNKWNPLNWLKHEDDLEKAA